MNNIKYIFTLLLIVIISSKNLESTNYFATITYNYQFISDYYYSINPNPIHYFSDSCINIKDNDRYVSYSFKDLDTKITFKRPYFDDNANRVMNFGIYINNSKINTKNYIFQNQKSAKEIIKYFNSGSSLSYYKVQYGTYGKLSVFRFGVSTNGQGTLSYAKDILIIKNEDNYSAYFLDKDHFSPISYGDYNNDGKFDFVTSVLTSKKETMHERTLFGTSYLINFEDLLKNEYTIDSLDHFSCDQWGCNFKIL